MRLIPWQPLQAHLKIATKCHSCRRHRQDLWRGNMGRRCTLCRNWDTTDAHDPAPNTHTMYFLCLLNIHRKKNPTNSRNKPSPTHMHRHTLHPPIDYVLVILTHTPWQIELYHFKLFEQRQQTRTFTHRSSCPNTHTTLTACSPDCLSLICSVRVRVYICFKCCFFAPPLPRLFHSVQPHHHACPLFLIHSWDWGVGYIIRL